ncbi:hypothetical protein BC827DRAFT_428157 [Russula dissimulans]|nr:hypothetical protein BC827DRAFT_428157 [Russula dissimulans]
MQWSNLLAKLSPERIQPILREGQCNPVSDYTKTPNMPAGHYDSPPEPPETDDQDGSSSIGDSSLLAPPTSHRRQYSYSGPQRDPYELHSLLDGLATSHDPPGPLATTIFTLGSPAASSGLIRTVTHSDYLDGTTLPNPHPLSPHLSWLPGRVSPPMVPPPHQSLVYPDGYAPAESLPPQHYVSPARTVPPPSAPLFHPRSGGASLFSQAQVATPPNLAVVPPNSELARTPRFTFAPPGTDVPADPIASTTAASPTSARSWRDKAKAKLDKTSQQLTQEGSSGRRARSNSWTVVSSVFRRRSGVCRFGSANS